MHGNLKRKELPEQELIYIGCIYLVFTWIAMLNIMLNYVILQYKPTCALDGVGDQTNCV